MKQLTVKEMRVILEAKNIKGVALLKNTEVRNWYQKLFKNVNI